MEQKSRYIHQNAIHVQSCYGFIVVSIKNLESNQISLSDSFSILNDAIKKVKNVTCPFGREIFKSFERNIAKSPDFDKIIKINNVLNRAHEELPSIFPVKRENFDFYKMCIMTSCDVERTFSRYQNINRDNRASFEFVNLKKHVIINCNSKHM